MWQTKPFRPSLQNKPTWVGKPLMKDKDTDEEDEHVYTVGRDKQPMCQVKIDEKQVEMMVDSGASVDLIDENTFRVLYKEKAPEKTKRRIFSYGSPTPLPLLGTVKAEISANANSNKEFERRSYQASHKPWRQTQATTAPPHPLPCQKGCRDGVEALRRTRHHQASDRSDAPLS